MSPRMIAADGSTTSNKAHSWSRRSLLQQHVSLMREPSSSRLRTRIHSGFEHRYSPDARSSGHQKYKAIRVPVGSVISLLWPLDGQWRRGTVTKYDPKKALHTVAVSESESKRIDFRRVPWRYTNEEDDINSASSVGHGGGKSGAQSSLAPSDDESIAGEGSCLSCSSSLAPPPMLLPVLAYGTSKPREYSLQLSPELTNGLCQASDGVQACALSVEVTLILAVARRLQKDKYCA